MAKATAQIATEPDPFSAPIPKTSTAMTIADEYLDEVLAYAGAGSENKTTKDYVIPRIAILQALSPQVIARNPKQIPGAESGMLFNTLTQEVFSGNIADNNLQVIPIYYTHNFFEWKPRESGGGLVKIYSRAEGLALEKTTELDSKNRRVLSNKNILVEAAQHLVKIVNAQTGEIFDAMISMSSTALKCSRQWNSIMGLNTVKRNGKTIVLPTFSVWYRVGTKPETRDGNTWNNWHIEPGGSVSRDLFSDSAHLYTQVSKGDLDIVADTSEDGPSAEG